MMNKLPPRTDFDATQWGFTTRDFGIAIGGIFLGILQVITPYASIFIRLILFAIIVIAGAVFAFWRVDKVYTLEEYLINLVEQWRGHRRVYTKDGADIDVLHPYSNIVTGDADTQKIERIRKITPTAPGKVLFIIPRWFVPKSNEDLLYSALSIFSFVLFISWIGTGGVKDAQNLMINFGKRLW